MVTTYPPAPLLWQNRLALDFTHSQIAYVGYEGTIFHISGPFAPLLGAQEGVVLKDIGGLDPPFKMLDNRGARQDGTTWYDALYDPGLINMSVKIGGTSAASFRQVFRAWWGAWDPRQVGKLCWFSPERGEWWALARLAKPVPNTYKEDFYQSWLTEITWTLQNDNAFWFGPPSVCQVSPNSQVNVADDFTITYPSGLSPNWTQVTSGPGEIASLDSGRVAWVPSGTTTGTAIAEWQAATTVSDDQTISLVVDGDMPQSTDTIQTIVLNSPVANGTFTLTSGGQTTQPIAYGASSITVELELEALSSILVNNVSVASKQGGAYDATGVGFVGNSTTPNYSHTLGSAAQTLVAYISVWSDTAIPIVTAQVGGSSGEFMVQWDAVLAYQTSGGDYASLFAFVLDGPPTGAQNIFFRVTGTTSTCQVACNSTSYNFVTIPGIPGQAQAVGTNPSMASIAGPGQIVSQCFAGYQDAFSAYTQTQRYYQGFSAGSNLSFLVGDATGTSQSVTFGLTAASNPWAGIVIPLYSPNLKYTATFVGAKGNQVVPTMTGTTSWNGSSGLTITSLQAGAAAYIDLWGRLNSTGPVGRDGIRARFGFNTVQLSAFNGGLEFDLWSGTCTGPNNGDQLSLQCGVVSPLQSTVEQLFGDNFTETQYQIYQNGFPLIPGGLLSDLEDWFGISFGYTDVSGHSLFGPTHRLAGFGMSAGGNGTNQVPPPPVGQFNAGTGTSFITITNFGDQPGFPSYLCYGPGTFLINDPGTNNMISFGPLLSGQIALLNTNPRLAPVVDLTPPAISPSQLNLFQQLDLATTDFLQFLVDLVTNNNLPPLLQEWESIFGLTPPQGPLTSLLTSRFTQSVMPMLEQQGPVVTHIPWQIQGGNDQSKIVASITPMRRWPE